MKTLNLNEIRLEEISSAQAQRVKGGFWNYVIQGLAGGLIISLIENWQDVREGWSDGYNVRDPRH